MSLNRVHNVDSLTLRVLGLGVLNQVHIGQNCTAEHEACTITHIYIL